MSSTPKPITHIQGEFTNPTDMIAAIKKHRELEALREAEEERLAEQAAQNDPEVQAWIEAANAETYTALITAQSKTATA